MTKARTRFAPSPTGDLHIGGIRTAIFSWLLARHTGGEFYLRLEDTDQDRYTAGSARRIMQSFDWLGIALDGGPDHAELATMKSDEDFPDALADGDYKGIPGPFVQSHRLPIYKEWAEWLVANGYAYRANETPEEIQRMRETAQAQKQTFVFREEMRLRTNISADEPYVIRMRVLPRDGKTTFTDLVKGPMSFDNATVDDQVLLKMDGFPTYHLAVVIDDHLQGVTHVLRGDDWLPSAPKHVLLYQYFGWAQPRWAHVPNVLGTDGKKLSKRHGAQSVFEFRDQGYIPEALINFLALLGWAPGGGDEQNVFTREELFAKFSMNGVGSSPAVFDYNKLDWLNGVHLRKLSAEDLADRLIPFLSKTGVEVDTPAKRATLVRIVPQISERIKKLNEAAPFVDFFFNDIATPPADMLIGPKMEKHLSLHALRETLRVVENIEPFDEAGLEQALRTLGEELQLKPNQLFTIVRNAVTGKSVTPPLFATMSILGRGVCVERLQRAERQLVAG
jgi:glutamyl-tRNA synthetase